MPEKRMKQTGQKQQARKPESPFVPQKRINDSPQLKFKKPEETEEWLLSREKTDYTYSRSASYSSSISQSGPLRRIANSYETPIMSRSSQDENDLLPQTPYSAAPPGHRYQTRSSARRGNRLKGEVYDSTPKRGAEKTPRARRVNRSSTITQERIDESWVGGSRNGETAYSNGHESGIYEQSLQHSGLLARNNQKNQSLSNIYGLDGNESDFSDNDMQSQSTSMTTITTTTTTTTTTTWLQQQGDYYNQQYGLYPLVMRTIISILTVVETVVRTVATSTVRGGRSVAASARSAVSSAGYSIGDFFRWLLSSLKLLAYRCFSALRAFWYGPWLYSFCRAPINTLKLGPQYGLEGGLHTSDFTETTTTTTTTTTVLEEEEEERRRRKGGGIPLCCFCLPLLLLLLLLTAATTGRYLFLLSDSNETTAESPFHSIHQQFIFLQDRINFWATPSPSLSPDPLPPPGEAAALKGGASGMFMGMGVEGCIKCLQREQLVGWIDSAVKREVGELKLQLYTQKEQILLLQQLRSQQANELLALQTQLADSLETNPNAPPSRATMQLINSLESQITELKGNLRNIQVKVESSSSDDTSVSSSASTSLRRDFTILSDSLAGLSGSLQRLHAKCAADVQHSKSTNRQHRGDISSVHAHMLTLSQKIAEVQGLELTLIQLKREMETLTATDGQHSSQLGSIVANINSVEGSVSSIRRELREMEFNITEVVSENGAHSSQVAALYNDMAQLKQDMTEMRVKNVGYEGAIDGLTSKHASLLASARVMESDLSELRTTVNQLMSSNLNTILETLGQLQGRLTTLEKDSGQLQVSLSTLQTMRTIHQGEASTQGSVGLEAVEALQTNLNKLATQFAGLQTDIANVQLKVTELKTSATHTTQTVSSHSMNLAALSKSMSALEKSLNGSLLSLPETMEGVPHSLVSVRDMNTLKKEMDAVHLAINKLKNDVTGETASGITILNSEITSITQKIESLEGRLDGVKLESSLADLDGTMRDMKTGQVSLKDELATLQLNTGLLQKQTSRSNGEVIQLSVLESRLNNLAESIQGIAAGGATAGNPMSGCSSTQNLDWLKGDVSALRDTLEDINSFLFAGDITERSRATFLAALQDKLTELDAALLDLRTSHGGGVSDDGLKAAIAALQSQMQTLVMDIQRIDTKQQEMYENSNSGGAAGLTAAGIAGAAFGGAYGDDLSKLKANMSQLQQQYAHLEVDVVNCCKNKSGLAALPWFLFGSGSSSGGGGAGGLGAGGSLDEDRVKSIVLGALDMYNADKTGMVDYALESAGGSIISTRCSETYAFKTALFSLFGIPLWYLSNSPRTVIQPDVHPGNCWAFKGTQGFLVIQLASTIKPTAFSLEHIPKSLDPQGAIDSAPKNFSVWGLRDEYDHDGFHLGSYIYDQDGNPLQFFPVQNASSGPIPFVELKIESNHGNMEYTCLYRFRVHGVLHR